MTDGTPVKCHYIYIVVSVKLCMLKRRYSIIVGRDIIIITILIGILRIVDIMI